MVSGRLQSTPEAVEDLDRIWDYIAQESPRAADRLLDELQERFDLLAKNPEMGERQPMLADGTYRRFVYRNYVIYYRPLKDGIVLVRILHGAQSAEQLL